MPNNSTPSLETLGPWTHEQLVEASEAVERAEGALWDSCMDDIGDRHRLGVAVAVLQALTKQEELRRNHRCCACCGKPATYVLTDPTDASAPAGTPYCESCTTSTSAGFRKL